MRLPTLPKPVIHSTSGPIFINQPTDGYQITNREIVAVDSHWAAVIDHTNHTHTNDVMRDCLIRGVDNNKWGVRRYKIDGLRENIVVRDINLEHAFYESPGTESLTYRNCAGINIGAQFIQIRHTQNRSDPYWALPRTITVEDCQAREVGKESGAGRAGFCYSIKDMGPLSDVVLRNIWARTVKQTAVKVYNGNTYDSFGAVCVEYCRSLVMEGFHIEMKNPDRDVVQLFDYGNKGATRTGPASIAVKRGEILRGGNMAVRVGDGNVINIGKLQGDGRIRVFERDAGGVWRYTAAESKWLTEGFQWSK